MPRWAPSEGFVGQRGARRPKGFLLPASLAISGNAAYIRKVAVLFTDAVGEEPEEEVAILTVVKVEGFPGMGAR